MSYTLTTCAAAASADVRWMGRGVQNYHDVT